MESNKLIDAKKVYQQFNIPIKPIDSKETFENYAKSFQWPVMFYPALKLKSNTTCTSDRTKQY